MNVYDVSKTQSHSRGKRLTIILKSTLMVIVKPKKWFLAIRWLNIYCGSNFFSQNNNVKVITHPKSTTEDMLDYIKLIARRKPHTLIIHTGTNDLTNGINTMKNVRKFREN